MDDSEETIAEFFSEFPDTRMGISYDKDVHLFTVLLSEQIIGAGRNVTHAIFDAKKNLAIKKVKTLAWATPDQEESTDDGLGLALKRAAMFASDKEMADLVHEIRRGSWKK
jgi:hypothetical protein